VPRDIASRQAKNVCDEGRGVGPGGLGVYLDFSDAMERLGRPAIEAKYGNLFDMYAQITGEDPYEVPMRIYPAVHYTMGGLWVDYDLQSTIPGMFVIGEANFSDHGANRLGASALMQGLADGYFVLPNTINDYLADGTVREGRRQPPGRGRGAAGRAGPGAEAAVDQREPHPGVLPPRLGRLMWDLCGMERSDEGLRKALDRIPEIRQEFWTNLKVSGDQDTINPTLEHAGRVADFIELAELMCVDALHRNESCGGHFRAESQTPEGEALRDDENYAYVAAWEWTPEGVAPVLHREALEYEYVHLAQRSYK
jgi:succinate dehydrogenase / fumarate reductase flavoprotein subunit